MNVPSLLTRVPTSRRRTGRGKRPTIRSGLSSIGRTPHSIMGLHTGGNDMHKLVLLRHGESTWNLENRFTGWTDVDLSPKGVEEANGRGEAPEGGRLRLRRRAHVAPQAGDPDALDHPRGHGPPVDPGEEDVASQRAPLRGPPGPQQGGDREEVRRRAGEDLAPRLRDAAARRSRRTTSGTPGATRATPASRRTSCPSPSRSRTRWPASCRTGTTRSCRTSRRASAC